MFAIPSSAHLIAIRNEFERKYWLGHRDSED